MKRYKKVFFLIISLLLLSNYKKIEGENKISLNTLVENNTKKKFSGEIVAPISGKIIPLSEVPDDVFAQKMIGDGIAIEADSSGLILAPASGELVSIFNTNNAFSIVTADGIEIFLHFGLDTVLLEGKGFERLVEGGSIVKVGEPLIKYDYNFIKENAKSMVTPIIISNYKKFTNLNKLEKGKNAIAGKSIILNIQE